MAVHQTCRSSLKYYLTYLKYFWTFRLFGCCGWYTWKCGVIFPPPSPSKSISKSSSVALTSSLILIINLINQPINQSINQSISQSFFLLFSLSHTCPYTWLSRIYSIHYEYVHKIINILPISLAYAAACPIPILSSLLAF